MWWVNDLASVLGIPAGAATLAVAMYFGCAAAEKAARPEALQDIGRILKDPSWENSVRPAAIVERMFVWTFGERHLSWKCVGRSMLATAMILIVLSVAVFTPVTQAYTRYLFVPKEGTVGLLIHYILSSLLLYIVATFLADYLSLLKARRLTKVLTNPSLRSLTILCMADVLLSAAISVGSLAFVVVILNLFAGRLVFGASNLIADMLLHILMFFGNHSLIWVAKWDTGGHVIIDFPAANYICSVTTLFTSIWMVLIALSTSALKLFSPVRNFTAWFFDVDEHPVQAIGIVAGALVMIGSLVWAVVRAMI
jgi:hypothetical protein